MAVYNIYPKLGRFQMPTDPVTIYALIDVDGRAMVAPNWTGLSAYRVGDHVIYGDNLWRCKSAISAPADPEEPNTWDATKWDQVTVDSEIKRLEGAISGGIHYRGKTTTALYDGSTTATITINGQSYIAETGDLVIVDADTVSSTYAVNTAYAVHAYVKNGGLYYIVNTAVTANENTSFEAIESKLSRITGDPEFLFDGTAWAELGSVSDGLGDLAFKDTASGPYVKPTGSGSVTINTYTPTTGKLSTTSITGTNGTVNCSEVSVKTTKSFAVRAASATTVAVADAEATKIGNADVDTAVAVGTSLTGTKTFNTDAIKSATLTGTTTFVTSALKAASLTGTTTFATVGVTASVDDDILIFTPATTNSVSLSTTACGDDEKGTVGINTTAASTGTVGLGTTSITPAKAVSASSATLRGVSGTTDIYGTTGTDTAISELTITARTPAAVAASPTTVATGAVETGDQLVTGITAGTTSASVTVNTTSDTVVVG